MDRFQARTTSPERRRGKVRDVCAGLGVSERRACRVLGQPRSAQRRPLRTAGDEERLTAEIVALAVQYGQLTATGASPRASRQAGWVVNAKRVERIWRREGREMCREDNRRRAGSG